MKKFFYLLSILTTAHISFAAQISIPMQLVAPGLNYQKCIGTVIAEDTPYGLKLIPHLKHLPPGIHGFHIHQFPNCGDHGKNAGGHLDPQKTHKHLGPYGKGHLGDLPVLIVGKNGEPIKLHKNDKKIKPLLAPRLTVANILGHSLMIHKHGDNYSDHPQKLGGGGERLACGVIKKLNK